MRLFKGLQVPVASGKDLPHLLKIHPRMTLLTVLSNGGGLCKPS
jgi:hypothetical protein